MARKTKKVTKTAGSKRGAGKAAKKSRKPASKASQPAVATTGVSSGAMALLRAWSPSRYSTR